MSQFQFRWSVTMVMLVSVWKVFAFSRIRTEYGEIRIIYPHSVRLRENTDQNNSEYGDVLSDSINVKTMNNRSNIEKPANINGDSNVGTLKFDEFYFIDSERKFKIFSDCMAKFNATYSWQIIYNKYLKS